MSAALRDREIVDDARLGERQAGHVAAEAQQLGDRADPRARRSGGARSSHFLSSRTTVSSSAM